MHGDGPVAVVVGPPDVGMVVPVGVVGPGAGARGAVEPVGGHAAAAVEGARPVGEAVPTDVVVSRGVAVRTADALVEGLRSRELDVVLTPLDGTVGRANVVVVTGSPAGTVPDVGAAGGAGDVVCDVVAAGAVGGVADVTGVVGVVTVGTAGRVNAVSGIDGKTLDAWTTVVGGGGRAAAASASAALRSTSAWAMVMDDVRASRTARPAAYRRVTLDDRRLRDSRRRGTRLGTNARRVLRNPAHRPWVMPESSRGTPQSDASCPPPTAS